MKKKLLALVLILIMALLTACGSGNNDSEDSYNSDWMDSLQESQGIQIKDAKSGTVYATYSEDAEIEEFISELKIDEWEPADISEGKSEEYEIVFYKMDKTGENQSVVGTMTTYADSPVIKLESLGLELSFTIPESSINTIENAQP